MGIDIKYHIVSLAAVFLALTTGMLMGISLSSRPAVERQIKRLATQFSSLRDENQKVREQLRAMQGTMESDRSFIKTALPSLLKDRLSGQRVALIHTSPLAPFKFHDELVRTLQVAGAEVTSTTTMTPGLKSLNGDLSRQIVKRFRLRQTGDEVMAAAARKVAKLVALGDPTDLLAFLEARKVVSLSGSYLAPVDCVVLIGGGDGKENTAVKQIDQQMIAALKSVKSAVVGCEPSQVTFSYIGHYQRLRIPTVDNVDSLPGQVALAMVIVQQYGNYGVKPTADALLPKL